MEQFAKEIFKAIHEGLWLDVNYQNKEGEETKYWIAIKKINPFKRLLTVDGLHLGTYEIKELFVSLDGIKEIYAIDGTYAPIQKDLIEDIRLNPEKYIGLFDNVINLGILNYLRECYRLDNTPYKTSYTLVDKIDDDVLSKGYYKLDNNQFDSIMKQFYQRKKDNQYNSVYEFKQFALNQMSINTKDGLYVLAYQPIRFDIKHACLLLENEIIISQEFTIEGKTLSVKYFLDEEDLYLLNDFEKNQELIRDIISKNAGVGVDDMPYIIEIGRDCIMDLEKQYQGILNMYLESDDKKITPPIDAFFGNLTIRPRRTASFPIALINKNVNLDQLLAINNALRYPISYVQGPPGTGKTQTIINTIISCFFNDRTVLFSSYNNHPINEVRDKLMNIKYKNKRIPFPIARLGNNTEILKTLKEIKKLFEFCKDQEIYQGTLDKNKKERSEQAKELTSFLQRYDEKLDLIQKKEALEGLLNSSDQMNFQISLQTDQLPAINKRIIELGEFTNEEALNLINTNEAELKKYLYYTSIKFIKRISEPKNEDFLKILNIENEEDQVVEFNRYISKQENLKKFLRIFPIIATTCIGARKLGEPIPSFDITIIDEAGQCNTAVTLVPIVRSSNLMMVGDPQQLQPVIQLNEIDNKQLMEKYGVSKDYDYVHNSVYKTFLACDPVSDEVLLSYHYRCDPKIINFNNKKYYNQKLRISSKSLNDKPLEFIDVKDNHSDDKNASLDELNAIKDYLKDKDNLSVGVITPFVKQKELLIKEFKDNENINCGTVHTFQGDEKDVILFSLAITDKTRKETYDWLKNNKELINVATSRAKSKLVIVGSSKEIERLHDNKDRDDLYELIQYVINNGETSITSVENKSRALGIKPYSSETESAFLINLNHALNNAFNDGSNYKIYKEVPISQVFENNNSYNDFFYKGRFDFVIYQKREKNEYPVLAIELDGKEHYNDEIVKIRDEKKNKICKEHGFDLIRVENSYARRYHYIKDILINYFEA